MYQDRGQKFKYSTKIQTSPELWTGSRVKGKSLDSLAKNKALEEIQSIIGDIEREALIKQMHFDIETVERKFRAKVGQSLQTSEFFALYDQFIEEAKSTKTVNTIKQYKTTKTQLLAFETLTGFRLTFDKVNQRFYERLIDYN